VSIEQLPEGTVTILFTDVEGSTDLRTREGDDVAQHVLRTHERLLREQLALFGGWEVVFMGDGFMVAFGSARRAVECAIAIQRCFRDHNLGGGHAIRVRMGLNTGEVLRESGTLYGTAVNAAARISAKAVGGQILCSQIVRDVTTGVRGFDFIDRGLQSLKGFPEQWRLFEILWDEKAAERPEPASAKPRPVLAEAYSRPEAAPVVGRAAERAAIEADLDAVLQKTMRVVSVEGEAGIGKTRLLEAAVEAATVRGFGHVMVAADEELRGPFFLLRTLLSSTTFEGLADEALARDALERARDAVWGRDEALSGLAPNEQLLRVYDAAALAIRRIAETRPLTLLFDDIQWADEDSLKLIRYLVRTSSTIPVFLMLANRPEVGAATTAATSLVADLERMRLARRFALPRLTRIEAAELLRHLLGAPVSAEAAATLHARGEGVPFFIVEFARSFREAGLFTLVEGAYEVSAAARSTVPPSVQILIERRLAQLPPETREVLADAAVIGRRFRLGDLAEARLIASNGASSEGPAVLADTLAPAAGLNLMAQLPEGAAYDCAFTHDEIRNALVAGHARPRRRAIHAALAHLIEDAADRAANVPALAYHYLEAGDAERGVRYSIDAATAALDAFAPEEALRAVDAARGAAGSPEQRWELLCLRDRAQEALGRPEERASTLVEMTALARALGDEARELEVTIRRASAARQALDADQALELAGSAVRIAQERGDRAVELRALLELGQIQMRSPMGETYSVPTSEVDLDGAAETFGRARALASELGDEAALAAVTRELAVIELGRSRQFLLATVEMIPGMKSDPHADLALMRATPEVAEPLQRAEGLAREALEIFGRLGDQRGEMSSLILMAYSNIIDDTQHGHAGRIEQIRRLRRNLRRMTSESERAESEGHMLYSMHVYARGHGPPDLALQRGIETYEQARSMGDRRLEFLAAGGIALVHAQLSEPEAATSWLDRAAAAIVAEQGVLPARQLETWRGIVASSAGNADAMQEHLERALAQRGSAGGRCEVLATLAVEAARHGIERAQSAAEEALRLAQELPRSDAQFQAQAHSALAQIALTRGDGQRAIEEGLNAASELERIRQFFSFLFPEMQLLTARAVAGVEDPVADKFRAIMRHDLQYVVDETRDDDVRSRWLRSPVIAELIELVGAGVAAGDGNGHRADLDERELQLLRGVMSGKTNKELAAQLELADETVSTALRGVFSKLGVTSRSQAAAAAVVEGIS
jgi:class 3 adenylate cyclase/DNA-binding CsgD family transcriptional regulator/tetratricopeptide (TPR) repeat protein